MSEPKANNRELQKQKEHQFLVEEPEGDQQQEVEK
jgi:hypothetical protein